MDLKKQGESIKIKKGKNYLCTKTHKYAGSEWIEGVKYYSPEDYSLVNQRCTYYCPKYSKEEHNNFFKEVEYNGCLEVDKSEPKFKVGDWVIVEDKTLYQIEKVTELPHNHYQYWTTDGHWFGNGTESHLWTIQDAKDGDVLLFEGYYNSIVLFQGIGINGKGRINYHCKCDLENYSLNIQGDVACLGTIKNDAEHYRPATKEQRDLLFQKMHEAGYTWNAETKKLIKDI